MGQAKHNPTAIAAKEGKLLPKKRPLGKAATRRKIAEHLYYATQLNKLVNAMSRFGGGPYSG